MQQIEQKIELAEVITGLTLTDFQSAVIEELDRDFSMHFFSGQSGQTTIGVALGLIEAYWSPKHKVLYVSNNSTSQLAAKNLALQIMKKMSEVRPERSYSAREYIISIKFGDNTSDIKFDTLVGSVTTNQYDLVIADVNYEKVNISSMTRWINSLTTKGGKMVLLSCVNGVVAPAVVQQSQSRSSNKLDAVIEEVEEEGNIAYVSPN